MSDQLNEALDELIQGEQRRIIREYDRPGNRTERTHQLTTTPSLWDQLNEATAYQGNGGAATGKPRLPITAGVVDLINTITRHARQGAHQLTGTTRPDTPANLRAIVANTNDPVLEAIWRQHITGWTNKAREVLGLDPPRPRSIRDTPCPTCGQRRVTIETTEPNGEDTITPALAINWQKPTDTTRYPPDEWLVRAIECRACQTVWWRGPDLNQLVHQMLHTNHTHETLSAVQHSDGAV